MQIFSKLKSLSIMTSFIFLLPLLPTMSSAAPTNILLDVPSTTGVSTFTDSDDNFEYFTNGETLIYTFSPKDITAIEFYQNNLGCTSSCENFYVRLYNSAGTQLYTFIGAGRNGRTTGVSQSGLTYTDVTKVELYGTFPAAMTTVTFSTLKLMGTDSVDNTAPAEVTGLTVTSTGTSVGLEYDEPADVDWKNTRIYRQNSDTGAWDLLTAP